MPPLYFSPDTVGFLALLVINGAALAYLASVRERSAATGWLVVRTVGAVAYWATGVSFAWATGPSRWVEVVVADAALLVVGIGLVQFAYTFLESPYPREGRLALWALVAVWLAQLGLGAAWVGSGEVVLSDTLTYTVSTALSAVTMALASVVLARKWRRARRAGGAEGARRAQAYAAFLVVVGVLVAAVTAQAVGIALDIGVLAQGVPIYLQAAHTLLLVVVYVQFAPEPTTFQVKLVGVALTASVLIVFAVSEVLAATATAADPGLPPLAGRALAVAPADGGYRSAPAPAQPVVAAGRPLALGDDDVARVALPFAFPVYGEAASAVWVSSNGALAFGRPRLPAGWAFDAERGALLAGPPALAVWHEDLDPSAGGTVSVAASPDSVRVTWAGVPAWSEDGLAPDRLTAAATLFPDGRVRLAYAETTDLPALVGLLPGGAPPRRPTLRFGTDAAGPGQALATSPALRVHARTRPLVWLLLGTAAFVLAAFPPFYHTSLVRPLRRLLGGVRSVNAGDLGAEVAVGARDEIGQLAAHFNQMTDSLRDYAGRMEELVGERTAALEATVRDLEAAQARLVQQEKLAGLGRLTAGIAHEIKNPLNFVTNFAQLSQELTAELRQALDAGDGDEAAELLADLALNAAKIREHGARADGIVRGMMDHARTPTGPPEPTDLNALVAEHAALAWHGARAVDEGLAAEVVTDLGPDVGTVPVRAGDLGRVVVNLVSNALDAVRDGDGPALVTVRTRRHGDGVEVTVEDTGPGIAPHALDHLFEPFFTTKPTGAGNTGLGLSISHDVVAAHGGTLTAANGPAGAVFTLRLPA